MRPKAFQVAITQTPARAQKANYAPIKAHTHKSVWEVRLAGQQKRTAGWKASNGRYPFSMRYFTCN